MLFAWGNLIILFLFLKKLLWVPVKNIIDQRQAEIDGLYGDAETAKIEADEMKEQYELKLKEASVEAAGIVKDATDRASRKGDEIVAQAQEEAAALKRKADRDIEMERARAMNELKDQISDAAVQIAGKIVEREVKAEDHDKLIQNFIDKVGE
jgi:F-type H+-transporting ATPase subunit b